MYELAVVIAMISQFSRARSPSFPSKELASTVAVVYCHGNGAATGSAKETACGANAAVPIRTPVTRQIEARVAVRKLRMMDSLRFETWAVHDNPRPVASQFTSHRDDQPETGSEVAFHGHVGAPKIVAPAMNASP